MRRRRPRRTSTARRSVEITLAEYLAVIDCRCRLLPGTHQALHCALLREQAGDQDG